jgi:23S rRNA (adenine1618-N6)-methyltransferase
VHPRNLHHGRYDFQKLTESCPALIPFVIQNEFAAEHPETIDFTNPAAVKMLNRALLQHFYGIGEWDIPPNYLCPPIPGRADYLHEVADLLAETNDGTIPRGSDTRVLDIGVGANLIYPMIGHAVYGWSFVGTDTDVAALSSAQKIIDQNKNLLGAIELRAQPSPAQIFQNILKRTERFALSICNPPFHASLAEAQAGSQRKWKNLGDPQLPKKNSPIRPKAPALNFGGQGSELWCVGGEAGFLKTMIHESTQVPEACAWFTSLVSKQTTLTLLERQLYAVKAKSVRILEMSQGQKKSRILAWSFTVAR